MRDVKAIYVTKEGIKGNINRKYANQVEIERDSSKREYEKPTKNKESQHDSREDLVICTCRRVKHRETRYYSSTRQIYRSQRYSSARVFTDIGVGSVKTLIRKRTKRIYLPETRDTGAGSSDLSSFLNRRRYIDAGYYDQKRTSSKCVGGVMEDRVISVISEKLSPIIQTKSGSTSPKTTTCIDIKNNNSYVIEKHTPNIPVSNTEKNIKNLEQNLITNKITKDNSTQNIPADKIKDQEQMTNKIDASTVNDNKDFSSDSLVQHVHNLENPSYEKQSKTSTDYIENKLEREYGKIFATKGKEYEKSSERLRPIPDFKSASLLRRRFEALRRVINKKEESKKNSVTMELSSQDSELSKRDVSIASDPPSLEARSYSKTKIFSPKTSPVADYKNISNAKATYRNSVTCKKEICPNWSTDVVDSEYQNVKGMFKLWGKKFNLEEDNYKNTSPKTSVDVPKKNVKKVELVIPKEEVAEKEKREVKRFSFFRRKSKDKKQPYKSKKGVTAGRCEVGDGFMLKIGAINESSPETLRQTKNIMEDEILRKAWLKSYLTNKIESRNSVQIRWNNKMYTTSSSTVFELMDSVYKNTGIVIRSKSEVTTGESSNYYSYAPQVNFMKQNIEAWMIPKTTLDKQIIVKSDRPTKENKKNIEVSFSNQKWYIDKSKAFSHKIDLVLHSSNLEKNSSDESSEYIMIDIPRGYFSDTSSDTGDRNQTTDEEVYNIVEYETQKEKQNQHVMDFGDHVSNDLHVTVSVKDNKNKESKILETFIKRPPLHRDVVIQGSNVNIPKRCDVIGVGIITQRDIRTIKKPILKIPDELTDNDSPLALLPQKKCKFAESYLQDYYRNLTPLGIDLFSWCTSDSKLRGSSEYNSSNSFNNQGDGSKSCPNILDDYQTSTIVSSCNTSSCSHCLAMDEERKVEIEGRETKKPTFFNKLKKKPTDLPSKDDGKRVLPKDSLEVFKRRKIYAASNKSNWKSYDTCEPCSIPSIEDKCAQKTSMEDRRCSQPNVNPRKTCKKHVSMQDCKVLDNILQEQLSDKMIEGILSFKGVGGSGCDSCKKNTPRRLRVNPKPIREIPPQPCIDSCLKKKNPACSKKNSPTCNVPVPPTCPVGPPSPCHSDCPPIIPPCQIPVPTPSKSCIQQKRPPCPRSPPCPGSPPRPRSPPCPRSPPESPRCQSPCRKSRSSSPPPCPPTPPSAKCSSTSIPRVSSCHKPPPCRSRTSSPPVTHTNYSKSIPPKIHSPQTYSTNRSTCKIPPCAHPNRYSNSRFKSTNISPPTSPPRSYTPPPCPPPSRKSAQTSSPDSPRQSSGKPESPRRHARKSESPKRHARKSESPRRHAYKSDSPRRHACKPESPRQSACKKCSSHDFPWPIKNQESNTPSQESVLSLCPPQPVPKKTSSKCTQALKRLIQKISSSSIKSKGKERGKEKNCRPDCGHRAKLRKAPPKACPIPPSVDNQKIPGLYLKKNPMPKSCSSERTGIIRLNSKENITVSLKKTTPSTEEIREGCNIKVKDEDGQTLYERKDYRKAKCDNTKMHLVKDMYRDSHIHRVSTHSNETNDMVLEKNPSELNRQESETALSNIIEINFNLKFKQGDKTAEFNIKSCGDATKEEIENEENSNPHDTNKNIYVIQDQAKQKATDIERKDVNIKIVIKKFKGSAIKSKETSKLNKNLICNEEFSRKISQKFQTVSTGYSDVFEQQAYSIHRTTIDLTSSNDKTRIQGNPSEELITEELTELEAINLVESSDHVTKTSRTENAIPLCYNDQKEDDNDKKSLSSCSVSKHSKTCLDNVGNSEKTDTALSTTDVENYSILDINHEIKNENLITPKPLNRKAKKEILKQIFETANDARKSNNKDKMKSVRQMLQAVLTSDSSCCEDTEVDNDLVKELTYASLKPGYFKNSDSMTNYYQLDNSHTSTEKSSQNKFEELIYPTEENNSECSEESEPNEKGRCLCSHLAAKLKIDPQEDAKVCCCRRKGMKDEETTCKIRNESVCNYKPKGVDVETQDSKRLTNRIESIVVKKSAKLVQVYTTEITKGKCYKTKSNRNNTSVENLCTKKYGSVSNHSKHELLNEEYVMSDSKESNYNHNRPSDLLQSHETKKAVLEIYAEKTVSDKGEHIVAKLPKFVFYNKESEIHNYQENTLTGFKQISRRNIVMMSITR